MEHVGRNEMAQAQRNFNQTQQHMDFGSAEKAYPGRAHTLDDHDLVHNNRGNGFVSVTNTMSPAKNRSHQMDFVTEEATT